jgi:hypothetical protein
VHRASCGGGASKPPRRPGHESRQSDTSRVHSCSRDTSHVVEADTPRNSLIVGTPALRCAGTRPAKRPLSRVARHPGWTRHAGELRSRTRTIRPARSRRHRHRAWRVEPADRSLRPSTARRMQRRESCAAPSGGPNSNTAG